MNVRIRFDGGPHTDNKKCEFELESSKIPVPRPKSMTHEYAMVIFHNQEHNLVKSKGETIKFMMKIEDDSRVKLGSPDVFEIKSTVAQMPKLLDTIWTFRRFNLEWESMELPGIHPAGPYLSPNAVATIWVEGSLPEIVFSHADELVFLDTVGKLGWELVEFKGKIFMRKEIQ